MSQVSGVGIEVRARTARWWMLVLAAVLAAPGGALAREPLEPPTSGDFTRVRTEWSKAPYVQPYWEIAEGRNAIFNAYRADDREQVLARAQVWLSKFPIDCAVHWMLAQVFKATGDFGGYARHMYWYRGLITSMHRSGSGESVRDAVKVVALREEYFFVRDTGGDIKAQEVVEVDGVTYHKVRADIGGHARVFYFDISVPLAQLERNTFPAPGKAPSTGAKPARVLPKS